ncbi:ER lumen protein retaining receptor [Sphaeroforma arctica JP610]|uniref:ER lumen protein retaining receptor n=1 Tax=Sphaeroforma arctica JP610 TaxID=667725 RepID=A0A0L0G5B6_9EUKA|nr:ER lumen protein retaining receptor [Sphaeroforma arctica JP610]KNC84011.1 ER lumen protein retaining receptor [Sphaeroforma arctica JP610]|eukprot:XP_014157913.1 ER lumen protein retaining receptor [Sphaeroforma arctica JP610]
MNIFRLAADISHAVAIVLLLYKIWTSRSCAGLSLKSQSLYVAVFVSRYLDIFRFVSFYNTFMKLFFIIGSSATVYLMAFKFKHTYQKENDSFPVLYLILPCIAMAFVLPYEYNPVEILWTFSIWQESVAIFPQLFMVQKTGEAESITSHYLFALGSYRGLYILNWIYRYVVEDHVDWISIVAGVIQTVLYCDFFYLYITRVIKGRKLDLPA